METVAQKIKDISRAVYRARFAIVTVASVYLVSVLAGIIMVHYGNTFALNYRDQLVGNAVKNDAVMAAKFKNEKFKAAMLDFAGNLVIGSIPKTLMGIGIVFPYPWVAYQGWVGGIVSVRGDHSSRLNSCRSAIYYLLTLVLQIAGYSLTVGAGVNVGISLFKPLPDYREEKLIRFFPKEALRDMVRIYILAAPIFLIGSLWEFLSSWNI